MISIAPADSGPTPALLTTPGGFAWWYAELLDDAGNGLVLIWSWALPFLPGLADAARRGQPVAPLSRPSLNLAVYCGGRLEAYWLEEFAADDVSWDGDRQWRFGASTLSLDDRGGRTRLCVDLDLPLTAGTPLRGRIDLDGVTARPPRWGSDARHAWTPLVGPATGSAALICGDESWSVAGRAYLDRNNGTSMLHELGIGTWLWAHATTDDAQHIAYVLVPDDGTAPLALGVRIEADGHTVIVDDLVASLGRRTTTRYGMPSWPRWSVCRPDGTEWLAVETSATIELGPFYLRHLCHLTHDGHAASGMSEVIRPDRIDRAMHRPLVRMRVGHPQGRDSMWRPLFTGPRVGRVARLLRSWGAAA